MSGPLPASEAERSQILRPISSLADLRPGSICAVARRCGKPTCHCAEPNDPGHDPRLRLTRKVDGKTVAESFASPATFRKAQEEIHECQRFQKLCGQLVAVNERICRLRPIEPQRGGWSAEGKNGCCDPSGSRAGNRYALIPHLRRASQNRRVGCGSCRIGSAYRAPRSRSCRSILTAKSLPHTA